MTTHATHHVHANSHKAYTSIGRGKSRKAIILDLFYRAKRPVTDREIARQLVTMGVIPNEDRVNGYRPRISDLLNEGAIREVPCDGERRCWPVDRPLP